MKPVKMRYGCPRASLEGRTLVQSVIVSVDDSYRITADLVDNVKFAVEANDQARLVSLLEQLHEADIADLLEQVDPELRRAVVDLWGRHFDSDVLSEVDESIQEELLTQFPPDQLAEVVRDLDSDDVVDLVEDLDAAAARGRTGCAE